MVSPNVLARHRDPINGSRRDHKELPTMNWITGLKIMALANLFSALGEISLIALLSWESVISLWIAFLGIIVALFLNTMIGVLIGTVLGVFNAREILRQTEEPERPEENDAYLEVHK